MCTANTPGAASPLDPAIGETGQESASTRSVAEERAREGVKVQIRWRLRQVMASRDVWTATGLHALMIRHAGIELSKQSVSDLVSKQPVQVKMKTLEALCTSLRCTPNELFGIDTPREVSIPDDADGADARG